MRGRMKSAMRDLLSFSIWRGLLLYSRLTSPTQKNAGIRERWENGMPRCDVETANTKACHHLALHSAIHFYSHDCQNNAKRLAGARLGSHCPVRTAAPPNCACVVYTLVILYL